MPEAAFILQLCAFLDRDNISEELFIKGLPSASHIQVQQAFNQLLSFSLIQRTSNVDAFNIHPLVHMWIRFRLAGEEQREFALEALRMLARGAFVYSSHFIEIQSYYTKHLPCDLDQVVDFANLDIGLFDNIRGLWLRLRAGIDSLFTFIQRSRLSDKLSSYSHWEVFHSMFYADTWRPTFLDLSWTLCQVAVAFGPEIREH